ncbi:hypothetical protein ATANTOWER_006197, partial [Ataeniobius toweri]|nr:hypothetical protein [Ataeniobius toweri]
PLPHRSPAELEGETANVSCWQADITLQNGSRDTTITCNKEKSSPNRNGFHHGLEKKAGTASHAFLHAHPVATQGAECAFVVQFGWAS